MVEDNSFGTHEFFFRLCELLDTEPYICGNVGSGTVREMSEWIEYMNFDGDRQWQTYAGKMDGKRPGDLNISALATKTGDAAAGCVPNIMPTYTGTMPHMSEITVIIPSSVLPQGRVVPTTTGLRS